MGYETKLIIGVEYGTSDEFKRGDAILKDGELYHPYLKDKNGEPVSTGRKETYFAVFATLDLCKCGHNSAMRKIDRVNHDENHYWYYYEGDNKIIKDPKSFIKI